MATVWRARFAFARLFGGKTGQILNNSTDFGAQQFQGSQSIILSRNYSNYAHSPFVSKIEEQYDFEIVQKPPEWRFVERLMPFEAIPRVVPKASYPSGWTPPREEAINHPFFIARTRNHELPIYLDITFRGMRKITMMKKIEGDIWLLNDELRAYLKEKNNRYVQTRVHEVGRFIEAKGDFVNDLREWALSKGF